MLFVISIATLRQPHVSILALVSKIAPTVVMDAILHFVCAMTTERTQTILTVLISTIDYTINV